MSSVAAHVHRPRGLLNPLVGGHSSLRPQWKHLNSHHSPQPTGSGTAWGRTRPLPLLDEGTLALRPTTWKEEMACGAPARHTSVSALTTILRWKCLCWGGGGAPQGSSPPPPPVASGGGGGGRRPPLPKARLQAPSWLGALSTCVSQGPAHGGTECPSLGRGQS